MNPKQNFNKCFNGGQKLMILIVLSGAFLMFQLSCKKLVETPPPTSSITEANVFSTDVTAISTINNLYISMNLAGSGNPIQGIRSISLLSGLSSDELTLYSGVPGVEWLNYYRNSLLAFQSGSDHWSPLYNYIFKCNAIIEALTSSRSDKLTPIIKKQLLGEAQFLRGYFYFYLINLFGDVPLCIGTDPEVNALLGPSPTKTVYNQIVSDLQSAEANLSSNFLGGDLVTKTEERVRPTTWAAKALLAKVFLFVGDYESAEEKSSSVINNKDLFGPLPQLNSVFSKNSREAIWQLQPTSIDFNTQEAITLVIPANGPNAINNPVFLSNNLLKSFEPGDLRAVYGNWIDTTIYKVGGSSFDTVAYAYKYKINSSKGVTSPGGMKEYFMILRLGEQYLIRAEAKAYLGKIGDAKNDLDSIRLRAGLGGITANDKASLLTAILQERRVELFTEGANRWFDLKRTGAIDTVMTVATVQKSKGANVWQSYQQLYPIPVSELLNAPNLRQNFGY